jgi:hypothetical protein
MKRVPVSIAVVCLLASAVPVLGAEGTADALHPFLDDQAFLVARLDLSRLDVRAFVGWLNDGPCAGAPLPRAAVESVAVGRDLLVQAGATEVWAAWSTADVMLLKEAPVPLVFFPTGDAETVEQALALRPLAARQVGEAVLAGHPKAVARAAAGDGTDRPDLAAALASVPDGTLQVAFIPTGTQRRALEETMPVLPAEWGSVPATTLTRGALRAAASIDLPPAARVHVVTQAEGAEQARALDEQLPVMLDAFLRAAGLGERGVDLAALTALLDPVAQGDRTTLTLTDAQVRSLAAGLLAPFVVRQRQEALAMHSMSNLQNIAVACVLHAEGHGGEWPESLQVLIDGGRLPSSDLLVNPRAPDAPAGYVYVRPAGDALLEGAVVLYEAHDEWPPGGVYVAFGDCHTELVKDQARFEELLAPAARPPASDP